MKKQSSLNLVKRLTGVSFIGLLSFSSIAQTNVFDDIIVPSPNHTTLEAALIAANLDDDLQNNTATLTVFAPDDNAFNALATELGITVNDILNLPNLGDILTYHVLGTTVNASGVTNGAIVTPLFTGNTLKLTKTSTNSVYVNHAMVTAPDLTASNGVVHSINAVLSSSETVIDVALDNGFTTLTAAVIQEELVPVLSDPFAQYTVFAPNNAAFDSLASSLNTNTAGLLALPNLDDVLKYHVLGSEVLAAAVTNGAVVNPLSTTNSLKLTKTSTNAVFVNHASVVTPDVQADNGVVHVINRVVLPVNTVIDVALDNGFTTLATAVIQEELVPVLSDPFAEYTVFAPNNAAFDSLASSLNTNTAGLLALPNLDDVLKYHVLGTEVLAGAVTNGAVVNPLSTTNSLKLTKTSTNAVFVNHASVVTPDVQADNGVVHVINRVVLPVNTVIDVALDNGFTTLATAVIQEELVPVLSDPFAQYTVFAPDNVAFDSLASSLNTNTAGLLALPNLDDVLKYHVLGTEVLAAAVTNGAVVNPLSTTNSLKLTKTSTNAVFVNHASVVTPDVQADNGVVHVINRVVLPVNTVIDVALDNGFTTLATAVIQEELVPVLSDPFTEYTVFAPSNTAFDNLATALGTDINGILNLPNLTDVLTYHVVLGNVNAADLVNGPVATVNGANIIVNLTNGVKINDATVTLADVEADNGVVHAIDKVLLESFLGINDNEASLLEVYPNPATEKLIINGANSGDYSLLNNLGQKVQSGAVNNGVISIEGLTEGAYLLQFNDGKKTYITRIIKK